MSLSAKDAMEAFKNTWLKRYPQQEYLGFDGGSEYHKNQINETKLLQHENLSINPILRNRTDYPNGYTKYSIIVKEHMS